MTHELALKILQDAASGRGYLASVSTVDNYDRVWARDGVITSLAALLSGDAALINTAKYSIQTIFDHQHPVGFMPSNVAKDGSVSYGGIVGRVDNITWAIIGLCQYSRITGDSKMLENYRAHVYRALQVLDAWEFNGKHLMYVPQSADWADEYIHHGYILYNQLLRIWALRLVADSYADRSSSVKAKSIEKVIQANYWKRIEATDLYAPHLQHLMKDAPTDFWLMGFNPTRVYTQFDLQANSLSLLLGIGDENQIASLTGVLKMLKDVQGSIVPSFYPSIGENDADYEELKRNYAYQFRNFPGEFHNGALWPVWNGFLIAGLSAVGQNGLATTTLSAMQNIIAHDNFEFNECYHGASLEPIGIKRCTWSAAGYLIGYHALNNNRLYYGNEQ